MAIISCPECGRNVSDQATACPDCAYPIAAAARGGNTGAPPVTHRAPEPTPQQAPQPAAQPAPAPAPQPRISEHRAAGAGVWALFGALLAGGGLVLVWVAFNWDAAGAAIGGVAAGLIAIGMGQHASSIAKQAAVVDPGASRRERRKAERRAIREHASMAGGAVGLGVMALVVNLFGLIGLAS